MGTGLKKESHGHPEIHNEENWRLAISKLKMIYLSTSLIYSHIPARGSRATIGQSG